MRTSRIVAVARRDLAMELKGRRGWLLPVVVLGLLLPISGAPTPGISAPPVPPPVSVSGDVPAAVLGVERVQPVSSDAQLQFTQRDRSLALRGGPIPPAVRAVLDEADPRPVQVEFVPRHLPLPGRSLLFALISASTLTGAVSASIGGERSARTLVALLSASISRAEIVLGKCLAWGGFGAGSALIAALAAVALGRVSLSWWILPMLTVPICAVALGLWLVRRASDVIGGTTVTLRVLPAVVSISGLIAWFVGLDNPLLGAAIPIGGALIAAGDTWGPDAAPALVATASTGLLTAWMLRSTWTDLEETLRRPEAPSRQGLALRTGALACLAWWPPVLGPLLWTSAGNARLGATLSPVPGVAAAALGLLLITFVHLARQRQAAPIRWLLRPSATHLLLAIGIGVALGWGLDRPLSPVPEAWVPAQARLAAALAPAWVGLGIATICAVATESLFRGWLQWRSGARWSIALWTLVCCPLDPITGVISGAALAGVAHRGGVIAALVAHGCWIATAAVL